MICYDLGDRDYKGKSMIGYGGQCSNKGLRKFIRICLIAMVTEQQKINQYIFTTVTYIS